MSVTETRVHVAWAARLLSYFVYAYFVIVEIVLGLGFILKLFGANPSAGFVEWAYRNLDRAMAPFRGMFAPVELGTASNDVPAVLDTSILFAMVVYAIAVLALRSLIHWFTDRIRVLERRAQDEAEKAEASTAMADESLRRP